MLAGGSRILEVEMQYRELGTTGERLSVVGFGGILVVGEAQSDADRLVASAVDRGVNYFDVAPLYGDGEAEIKLGPALAPYRKSAFLACKTLRRDAAGAREELERSLQRLQTDYLDLYQLHRMPTMEDVEQAFSAGGAMETLLRAREEGIVRFLGFSAHSEAAAVELLRRFPFDSVLCPMNFASYLSGSFGPRVIDAARRRGTGVLALKPMARTALPEGTTQAQRPWAKAWYDPIDDEDLASLAVRYTLSLPVTATIPPGHPKLWEIAYRAAVDPRALTQEEESRLRAVAEVTAPLF
jgi:aryl-alcohol dehydrogenase-like predicted oxidoreductase